MPKHSIVIAAFNDLIIFIEQSCCWLQRHGFEILIADDEVKKELLTSSMIV